MRPVRMIASLGLLIVLGGSTISSTANAQYGGYPGSYPAYPDSGQARGIYYPIGMSGSGYVPAYGPGVIGSGNGYSSGWSGNPGLPYRPYPSPAQRQGFREGERYWETGIAPNRPLSPAEARGFAAGERRAAQIPWQFDPVRQQGYREGQLYWETGQLPNRPLSPAEVQGFRAGENRAAAGSYGTYPY